MSWLAIYFGWPYGAVWSNLAASGICAVLVWWRARVHMGRHHAEQLAHISRVSAAPPIKQMTDREFGNQLRNVVRSDPAVMDTLLREQARAQARSSRPGGERL